MFLLFLVTDLEEVLKLRYNVTRDDLRILEMVILKSVPQKAGSSQWKFTGALIYATTVLTTIGIFFLSLSLFLLKNVPVACSWNLQLIMLYTPNHFHFSWAMLPFV